MKLSRTNATFAFFLALPLFFAGPTAGVLQTAHADTTSTATSTVTDAASDCTIMPADIVAITTAESQGLQAELAARKALLTRVITCAENDAQSVQTNVNAVSVSGSAATVQSQLSGKLDDAMNYYNIELTKVSQSGIAGTQAVAKEVLSWRTGNYDPLAAQSSNFILWAQNQSLFATANARLDQTEGIVSFVNSAAPNPELADDLTTAESLIQTANQENAGALTALGQFVSPDQSLALIQQSLQSLSEAYQAFSDIATTVQTLLPPPAATGS